MTRRHAFEFGFLFTVLALSCGGFAGLFLGRDAGPDGFQLAHVATSMAWLALLSVQWWVIRRRQLHLHRAMGTAVYAAAPVLVGTLTLLTVHSAAKAAAVGRADFMVVQNLMVTFDVALLLFLAILLRHQREVHGALMLSTGLLFMGVALFFVLIGYVPAFRGDGPGAIPNFAAAAIVGTCAVGLVGLAFFLADRRIGWPWLLAAACFVVNAWLQSTVAAAGGTTALTVAVASIDLAPAFAVATLGFATLLVLARRVN